LFHETANIQGEHVRIIQVTEPEFKKRNFDITLYEVIIIDSNEKWLVLYRAKGTPRGTRGSPVKGAPGFTVEVRKSDLSVIGSYLSR
jgi:hypothetical protein